MGRIDHYQRLRSPTLKYAVICGLAVAPLTLLQHWRGGAGHEFPVTMVVFGGLVAGYVATKAKPGRHHAHVGFWAGVIGAVPLLLLLASTTIARNVPTGTVWIRDFVPVLKQVTVLTVSTLGYAGIIGLLGGLVGSELARRTGQSRSQPTRN